MSAATASRFYIAAFLLHFIVIVAIGTRDTLALVAGSFTALPRLCDAAAARSANMLSVLLGQTEHAPKSLRHLMSAYFRSAGIERGYGYFAPNVPDSFQLLLELHYNDGRVEYDLPRVNSHAAGLRVASLLDEIARTDNDQVREYIIKTVARSVWNEHVDLTMVRAFFSRTSWPTVQEFAAGRRQPEQQLLCAYDFTRR